MFKDPKVQGAALMFVIFFIASGIFAYYDPTLKTQFSAFVFMAMGSMYTALCLFIKPDGGRTGSTTKDVPDASVSPVGIAIEQKIVSDITKDIPNADANADAAAQVVK